MAVLDNRAYGSEAIAVAYCQRNPERINRKRALNHRESSSLLGQQEAIAARADQLL